MNQLFQHVANPDGHRTYIELVGFHPETAEQAVEAMTGYLFHK